MIAANWLVSECVGKRIKMDLLRAITESCQQVSHTKSITLSISITNSQIYINYQSHTIKK